mmetsp:Transcript_37409/g.83251  ORF Transcript_37409/g.83251 Transcript_37409/m.83251 type:complete len:271 (-) Transcript_37409:288-1100(-)
MAERLLGNFRQQINMYERFLLGCSASRPYRIAWNTSEVLCRMEHQRGQPRDLGHEGRPADLEQRRVVHAVGVCPVVHQGGHHAAPEHTRHAAIAHDGGQHLVLPASNVLLHAAPGLAEVLAVAGQAGPAKHLLAAQLCDGVLQGKQLQHARHVPHAPHGLQPQRVGRVVVLGGREVPPVVQRLPRVLVRHDDLRHTQLVVHGAHNAELGVQRHQAGVGGGGEAAQDGFAAGTVRGVGEGAGLHCKQALNVVWCGHAGGEGGCSGRAAEQT